MHTLLELIRAIGGIDSQHADQTARAALAWMTHHKGLQAQAAVHHLMQILQYTAR
jgi:hypothetical protein